MISSHKLAVNGLFAALLMTALLFCAPVSAQTNNPVAHYGLAWTDTIAWDRIYNHHRNHTAIGGPPISRATNLAAHHS